MRKLKLHLEFHDLPISDCGCFSSVRDLLLGAIDKLGTDHWNDRLVAQGALPYVCWSSEGSLRVQCPRCGTSIYCRIDWGLYDPDQGHPEIPTLISKIIKRAEDRVRKHYAQETEEETVGEFQRLRAIVHEHHHNPTRMLLKDDPTWECQCFDCKAHRASGAAKMEACDGR